MTLAEQEQATPIHRQQQLGIRMLLVCLLLTFTSLSHAGNQDPLDSREYAQIQALIPPITNQELYASPTQELLLIERDRSTDKAPSPKRLANIFVYDYAHNETVIQRVDVSTNKVVFTVRKQHVQLPLTKNEIRRATDLIFSDPETLESVKTEYQRITKQTLSTPGQLQTKAFVFTADTLPEQLNAASQQCGLHRCAQVLLYTHDSVVFETSPIVNLSVGLVTQVIGF